MENNPVNNKKIVKALRAIIFILAMQLGLTLGLGAVIVYLLFRL